MKCCTLCSVEKPLAEFSNRKDRKDGLHFWCRPCLKQKKAEHYQRNRQARLAAMAAYRKENPEKVSEAKKRCYRAKPEQYAAKHKERYQADPEKYKNSARHWYEQNREQAKVRNKIYHSNNREHAAIRNAKYREANREKINRKTIERQKANRTAYNAYQLAYRLNRFRTEPLYALQMLTRRRILCALSKQGYRKTSGTCEIVGCTFEQLKIHIEERFTEGMTWENRGKFGWHVDHIIPLSSAKTEEDLLKLCHYSNLRPLWAAENHAKGSKMPEDYYRDKLGQL